MAFADDRRERAPRTNEDAAVVGTSVINGTTEYTPIITTSADLDFVRSTGIVVATSAGNLSFQFAQTSSNANNLTLNNSSSLIAKRVKP